VSDRHYDRRDKLLAEELEAAAHAGLEVARVEHLPRPWPAIGPALRFPRQAQFHPTKFLSGVVRQLLDKGVRVHTHSRAVEVAEKPGGVAVTVHNFKGPVVTCSRAIVATNTPVNTLVAIHTKQSGYQTYVIALRVPAGAFAEPVLLWDGLWEDDTSYHYVRLMQGEPAGGRDDLLIVGGEDHKTGQGPEGAEPYRCLEEWARRNFPMCGGVERRWSGEVMEPSDGVAYIGLAPGRERTFLVTGDSGNGMTHSAIAAMLIPDLIDGRGHPWATLYEPTRKVGWHAWKDYAQENLNTVAQYRDWLKGGTVANESEIRPGTGAVLTHGLRHLAVYKDESGKCTRMSAACPHLGGVVRWNDQEQTWDCPCHASRFDRHGRVIHGPANSDLTPEQ
jgi:glycine/D-amino acid oxidase-like deaminating enzyme/nitrite reductase/ring-hydroxylating ferredoxin subunit